MYKKYSIKRKSNFNSKHPKAKYSFGLIYRELLTGPITGKILDPRVDAIVNKMTMISPADRYANNASLSVGISDYLSI